MITRYATDRDIPELIRIINEAYRVEDFFVRGNRTNDEDIRRRMNAPGACFLVLEDEDTGAMAGAVWVEVRDRRGHFAMLSVDPAYQGKGLGRAMINAVEDHCRTAGCTDLDLEVVNLRLELPPFYEKHGFTACGIADFTDNAKLTRDAHLILMSKPLASDLVDA